MKRWVLRAAVLLASGSGACSAPPAPPAFDVQFRIVSDDGAPVAGANISASGRQLGETNGRGELEFRLEGREGEAVAISVQCGPEYRSPEHPPALRLTSTRRIVSVPGKASIAYEASCARKQRNVVVVARADKTPGIPVIVEGKPIAVTNGEGDAEALLSIDANVIQIHVGFDTTGKLDLLPSNPSRLYDLAPGDDIITVEQKFVAAPKPTRRRISTPRKHVPVRID